MRPIRIWDPIMKKLLLLLMIVCSLSACNETSRRTLPSTKGHFKGYGSVYTFNESAYSPEYVGNFPVYRKGETLRIYLDEDEEESYTLNELNTPKTIPGLSQEFRYVYNDCYYVDKDISY